MVTIDVEPDYGAQLGESYQTLTQLDALHRLKAVLDRHQAEPTQFIVGRLLEQFPQLAERALALGGEPQLHSYSHPIGPHDIRGELDLGIGSYEAWFSRRPSGYRAPYGRILETDYAALKQQGFTYSSSIFPTYRPGLFNNMDQGLFPWIRPEGLWEIPMAVVPKTRASMNMSFLKFFGRRVYEGMFKTFGTPSIAVIVTHLHDFIVTEKLDELPMRKRFRYLHHKHDGIALLDWMLGKLGDAGYRFMTMGALVQTLNDSKLDYHVVRH